MGLIANLLLLFLVNFVWSQAPRPTEVAHPGSETEVLAFERVEINALNRRSALYLPQRPDGRPAPLVVFGHGQALGENAYDATLSHLAKKGVAALFATYDTGFFDQNWRRMASDFNQITRAALERYPDRLDGNRILYSGHSKGAYVGLMAAGAPDRPQVDAMILFAPAGFDAEYLQALPEDMIVTLVWGESDTIIKKPDLDEIYRRLPVERKQFITVKDYPDRKADHYFVQNRAAVFGGQNGVSAFHYHGVWKWLVGGAWDLEGEMPGTSIYVYGDEAASSGLPNVVHEVLRSWEVLRDTLFKLSPKGGEEILSSLGLEVKKVWGSWYQAWLSRDQRIQLQQTAGLEKMGDNLTLQPLNLPNDFSTNLWHFKNPLGFDLRAESAWALTTGSHDVVVGVVDSGIALGHRDLAPNIWVNQAEKDGEPGVDDDGNGYIDDVHGFNFAANQANAQDNRGHGTMVSGLIGAVGDNQFGVMGMSWQVKMMSLNMFPNLWGNATLTSAIAAINYAIDNGAHIINASWGQASSTKEEEAGYDLLREVIARAHEKGILFVAAAGNNAGNNDLTHMVPATLGNPNILSVGAINRRGQAWSKTNFGAQTVHVMAPGEEVLTTGQDGGTRYATGTSLSAPLVTGLAVLMLSVNPNLSPEQIIQILEQSCQPYTELAQLSRCQGTLDAKLALEKAQGTL